VINKGRKILLEVKNLKAGIAGVAGNEILKGVDLTVRAGEIHAIMGINGSGKSTLSKVLAGHPEYAVTGGTASFEGKDLFALEPEERSRAGLFLAFQYPVEIPGVSNSALLRLAYNTLQNERGLEELDPLEFEDLVQEKLKVVEMDPNFLGRNVNEGSGLDIDALRVVAKGVNSLLSQDNAVVMVTHYQRLLNYIVPDYVHVMDDGRIVRTGGKELALELEARGYDWLRAAA